MRLGNVQWPNNSFKRTPLRGAAYSGVRAHMLVSDLVEDLKAALDQFPAAADWRVGIATYTDSPGSDISVMLVGSSSIEPDDELILVPEGLGSSFKLEESPFTAAGLLSFLQAKPELASFPAFAKSEAVEHSDGTIVSINYPLWGTGVQETAQLVYFYYGNGAEP